MNEYLIEFNFIRMLESYHFIGSGILLLDLMEQNRRGMFLMLFVAYGIIKPKTISAQERNL